MRAWTLFHIRGIPLRAHITLLIAVPYFGLIVAAQLFPLAELAAIDPEELRLPGFAWGLLIALGLFASVAMHELAHSLLALRSRRKVRAITLMLFGGVSHIEGEHDERAQARSTEAMIAAAGPLVSFGLAALFFIAYDSTGVADLRFGFFYMSQLNAMIAMFNLVPAYPLDGGRVLRALLSRKMGLEKGTNAAISIGKGFAIVFALVGLLTFNFILLLVALFVYSAGLYESKMLELRRLLKGVKAGDIMHRPLATVTAGTSVETTLDDLVARRQEYAAVLHGGGRMLGVADVKALSRIPKEKRSALPVGLAVNSQIGFLGRDASAIQAVEALADQGPVAAVVDEQGALEGLIDPDDIRRKIQVSELEQPRKPKQAA